MISFFPLLVLLVAALSSAAPLPYSQNPTAIFKRARIPASVTCGRTFLTIELNNLDSTNHLSAAVQGTQTVQPRVYDTDEIKAAVGTADDYKKIACPIPPSLQGRPTIVCEIMFDNPKRNH
jgi:hypothetical protein